MQVQFRPQRAPKKEGVQTVDSGWIKALELPAKITGGLFIASGVIWFLDRNRALNLDEVATWLRTLILIMWVGTGCLFGTSIIGDVFSAGVALLRKRAAAREVAAQTAAECASKEAARKAILAKLDTLSEREVHEAAKALKAGSPSFESWVHSTGAGQLIAKGLLYSPQGTYNGDHFPFTFHDFVWKALQERREEILSREAAYELERKRRR
jgi:hypothetical protein